MSNVPQTPNFKLFKPPFDRKAWHQYVNKNFETIDAVLTTYLDVGNIVGVWENSTNYQAGDRVIDPVVGQVFEAAVNNTSAASPTTFAQDRANNPTYWTSLAVTARGLDAWAPGTLYQPNDFVVSGSIYAVCIRTHTSSGVFANDIANWDYLIDLSVAVTLPSLTGKTLQVLRVNAGETAAEWTTAANIASWLSGLVDPAAHLHLVADLSDASPNAKTFLQAANYAAMRTALQVPNIAGDTFTGAVNVSTSITSSIISLTNSDAGVLGVQIRTHMNSASPAINDVPFRLLVQANDSGSGIDNVARIDAVQETVTATAEDARWDFNTIRAGATANRMSIAAGAYMQSATGGDKGAGTLNAQGLYINGQPVGQTITFSADKGGAGADTLTSGSAVQITFGTENWDIGSAYASNAWTPPAGKYQIDIAVEATSTNAVDGEALVLELRKAGATHRQWSFRRSTANDLSLVATCIVDASGTDAFTVFVTKTGAGNGTTSTSANRNFFQGTAL